MTLNQCKVSRLVGALMAAYAVGPVYATIAQDPLLSRTAAVEPNIVFVFDDSGSMPATAIYQYGGVASGMGMTGPNNDAVFDSNGISPVWTTLPTTFHGRSPDVNLIYYDPRVTYSRRINADGTFKAAGSTSGVSAFNVYFYKPAASSTYGVSSVNVTAKGSGYPASGVTASFPAPPSGGVRATASVQLSSSQNVSSVTVANGGGGYDAGVLATFSAPPAGGVRATGSVTLANHGNKVSTVNVIQNGSGYPSSGVVATFSAPPAGGIQATGTVVLAQSQQVNFVTVTDGGSYNSGAQATFSAPDLPGGVRARGTVVLLGRSIVSIIITNPGSGYTSPPSLSISRRRGGGGNTAQFNINMGSLGNVITGFNITNPGSGYTSTPSINLSGTGLGSGAQFSVNTATSRRIGGITISNGGSGYTSAPTITLSNVGAGVGAVLTVNTSTTNVISGITITNPGSGYSAQPQITLAGVGSGSGASFGYGYTTSAAVPTNMRWDGTGTPTTASSYFTPSYTPDGGSPLADGATVLNYPNTANSSTSAYPKFKNRTDCGASSCSWSQEQQNYANWYTYHRTRMELSKTGIGLAFQPLNPTFRLGWGTINTLDKNSVLHKGVRRFTSSTQSDFLTWLYGINTNGGTPNRAAINKVGQYYQRVDNNGPWADDPDGTSTSVTSSGSEVTSHAACRRSYAMLMTDGYYNDSFSLTDVDTSVATEITSPTRYQYNPTGPYADSSNNTKRDNTFADVAMKYWVTDLRANLANDVRPVTGDEAYWQHMNFYAIGLGVVGTLDATNPQTLINLTGNASSTPPRSLNWPSPSTENPTSIDDMWHATVNGRGKMLNAKTASELNSSVLQMMSDISGKEATQSGVAVSTASLTQGTKKYTPSFTSITWNGNITAYNLDGTSGNQTGVAWEVETLLSTDPVTSVKTYSSRIPDAADRKIYVGTGATSGVRAVDFTYSAMNTAGLLTSMNGPVTQGLIDYLRGDPSKEDRDATVSDPNTIYRARATRLGDIVNSTPAFVKGTLDLEYEKLPTGFSGKDTYRDFIDGTGGKKQRPEGVLFVGANDGMLHGIRDGRFDSGGNALSTGGEEVFAYVPNALLPSIRELSEKTYAHRYYVDGPNIETDAYFGGSWKNIVLGTTGAGAGVLSSPGVSPRAAVFAINTTALNTSADSLNANSVMWEVSSAQTDFSELGHVLTDVQAGPTASTSHPWVAVFGNGYESKSCKAMLYVVNLQTGARVREITTGVGSCTSTGRNGLGGVRIVRNDQQQIIGAYAGDLQGNLWKFNLSAADPSAWAVDLGGSPLLKAGSTQPITAPPSVIALPATGGPTTGYMVVAGTGKFFEVSDITSTEQQSFYSIWDPLAFGAAVIPSGTSLNMSVAGDKAKLVQQTISVAPIVVNGNSYAEVSANAVDYAGTPQKRGCYLDFVTSGQRLVYPIDLLANRFAAADTISPSGVSLDACSNSTGGSSFLYFLDAMTCGRSVDQILDTNGDGNVDTSDLLVSGISGKADGRNVTLKTDGNNFVNVSGGDPGATKISLSCHALGNCTCQVLNTCPSGSGIKSREWRQLFMR
jgi:type IV pilus assembly protein PilY1